MPSAKVILVGPSMRGGGAQTHFRALAQSVWGGTADVLSLADTPELRALAGQRKAEPLAYSGDLSYPGVIRQIRRAIAVDRCDLLFGVSLYPNLLVWMSAALLRNRPRTILLEFTMPSRALSRKEDRVRNCLLRTLGRRAYSSADAVAANSMDGARDCMRLFGVAEQRIVRLPNILDLPDTLAKAVAAAAVAPGRIRRPYAVLCGRLDPVKNVATALRAMTSEVWPAGLDLCVVGEGPEMQRLQAAARSLGVSDRVVFAGWLDNPLPVVARAQVSLLCSSHEGFSNSVLEAMALGVPVVTSHCSSDARDACQSGAAIGYEVGDWQGLASGVAAANADDDQARARVQAARSYIAPHLAVTAVPTYDALIEAVLSGAPMPTALTGDYSLRALRHPSG